MKRIKIASSVDPSFPDFGPYKVLDTVEVPDLFQVGEMTHYGVVTAITPYADDESDQTVIVKLDPISLETRPDESIYPKPPSSYNRIHLFPVLAAGS